MLELIAQKINSPSIAKIKIPLIAKIPAITMIPSITKIPSIAMIPLIVKIPSIARIFLIKFQRYRWHLYAKVMHLSWLFCMKVGANDHLKIVT